MAFSLEPKNTSFPLMENPYGAESSTPYCHVHKYVQGELITK